MSTLFKNATVVNAADTYQADVLVEGEKIALIGVELPADSHEVIDLSGNLLMPGGIDVHTHFDLPFGLTVSSDDFQYGHRAAAFGGTTTCIDFATQPKGGTLRAGLDKWHAKAEGKAQIDYSFHMTITDFNETVRAEIPSMIREGVTTLKVFTAYKGVYQLDDQSLFRIMETAAEHGVLVMVHAENGDVIADLIAKHLRQGKTDPYYHALSRPAILEGEATGRMIALAGTANCPLYVVHMTCAESVRQLRIGREQGFPVMGETCVQYLFLTANDLRKPDFEGAKFVCSPPLRTERDHEALWQALRDQTLQVVATDHCPFWFEGGVNGRIPGKELGRDDFSKIPNGLPVVEERLKMLWTYGVGAGRIDPNRFVELNSANPAKIFGLYPRKGVIAVGSDADLVVWKPEQLLTVSAKTHHMQTDYSVFEGYKLKGGPTAVYLRGNQIVRGQEWLGTAGSGQFLRRSPHALCL